MKINWPSVVGFILCAALVGYLASRLAEAFGFDPLSGILFVMPGGWAIGRYWPFPLFTQDDDFPSTPSN